VLEEESKQVEVVDLADNSVETVTENNDGETPERPKKRDQKVARKEKEQAQQQPMPKMSSRR